MLLLLMLMSMVVLILMVVSVLLEFLSRSCPDSGQVEWQRFDCTDPDVANMAIVLEPPLS